MPSGARPSAQQRQAADPQQLGLHLQSYVRAGDAGRQASSQRRNLDDEYEIPDEAKIPAANISDIDLSDITEQAPEVAAEIIRLGELLRLGDETPEEFRLLCQLLFDYGKVAEAEYLLQRNLEARDENHALYLRLFGRAKEEEFSARLL